jgi:hypothetical protein
MASNSIQFVETKYGRLAYRIDGFVCLTSLQKALKGTLLTTRYDATHGAQVMRYTNDLHH